MSRIAKSVLIGMLLGNGKVVVVALGIFVVEDSRNGPLAKDIPLIAAGFSFLILSIPATAFGGLLGGLLGASRQRRRQHAAMLRKTDDIGKRKKRQGDEDRVEDRFSAG